MHFAKVRYWVWQQPACGGQKFSLWPVCDSERKDDVVGTYHSRREARTAANTLNQAVAVEHG